MADEFETTQTDDWDIEDLLKEFEPEVEAAEKQADSQEAKNAKAIRKIAERQAKSEERERVDKLTSEFYAAASEDEREYADVLLAGVSDESKVKRMLDLAKAKAKAMHKEEDAPTEEEAEAAEENESAKAFSAPAAGAPPRPRDQKAEQLERIGKGDTDALMAALYPKGTIPGMK